MSVRSPEAFLNNIQERLEMAEGGTRLVDQVIITATPFIADGFRAFKRLAEILASCPARAGALCQYRADMTVWARPFWEET
ncbi:MAG: hypothetical protein GTO12_26930 [Proteobacteria bacterium]|nr:hypothetical protein [Pseudomonadota bacterium]